MKKTARRIINIILVLVLLFSAAMLLRQYLDNSSGTDAYADALQLAEGTRPPSDKTAEATVPTQPETTEAPGEPVWVPAPVTDDPVMEELAQIDLEALREVNPDVVGWIRIPDSKIDYPVMQGEDNDYYLEHTWDKKKNSVGSIFLEHRNNPNMEDFNTLIYGHNMTSGDMFAQLREYGDPEFYQQHPYVYLVIDSGVFRYEVFSSYVARIDSATYGLSFYQRATRENFLNMALENSKIETDVEPAISDRIVTLSTCSFVGHETRWVVHARLKMVLVENE